MNRTDKEQGVSVPQSPRLFRRKLATQVSSESPNTPQGKVVLGEVEEKLKSMRQKRLDRLSTFVAEQTKLLEEKGNKNTGENEIENAIMSMKHTSEEKQTTFTSIVEEHVAETKEKVVGEDQGLKDPRTPKLSRKGSNESDKSKQSSTKKFISKFNCATTQSVGSSIEDLTSDYEGVKSSTFTVRPIHNKPPVPKRASLEENESKTVEDAGNRTENYNTILSPLGKQRRGIYLYDTECKFLESEKTASMSSLTSVEKSNKQEIVNKNEGRLNTGEQRKGSPIGEVFLGKEQKLKEYSKMFSESNLKAQHQTPQTMIVEVKTRNSYEGRSTVASEDRKSPLPMKTFKRNSVGDILDGKSVNKLNFHRVSADESAVLDDKSSHYVKNTEVTHQQGFAKISKHSNLTSYKNIDLELPQIAKKTNLSKKNGIPKKEKSNEDNFPVPPKSPLPLPRRFTNEERILKKFQRNWDNLNDILENDSDVDADEIEDLKKTFEEVNALLVEYCTKLNKLERKSNIGDSYHSQKLNAIKGRLEKIGEEITKFKGLKRDTSYRQLSNKLSNCFLEINKIKSNEAHVRSERHLVLKQAEIWLKILESRVIRNEGILLEVLDAQVSSISTNIFNITKV